MDENSESPSPLEVAGEVGALAVGLTTVTIQIFPFALPLLILVIAPVALLGLAAALLVLPVLLPLWLGRRIIRSLRSPEGTSGAHERRPSGRPASAGRA